MAAEPPTQPPITGSDIQRLLGLTPAVKPDDEEEKKEEEVVEKPKVMTGEEMARLAGVEYGPREEEEGIEGTAAWGRLLAREQQEEEERKEGRLWNRGPGMRPGAFPPAEAAEKAPYLLDPSHPEYISEKEWIAQQEAKKTKPTSLKPIRHILRGGHRDPTLPKITTPPTKEEIAKREREIKEREERYALDLESAVRGVKDITEGKPIVWGLKKVLGVDEEMAKRGGAMGGFMAGVVSGAAIQKVPGGHPVAKLFAPVIGGGIGYVLGKYQFEGKAPTAGEMAATLTYASAPTSFLAQLPKLGVWKSMGVGLVELNIISEVAAQQQMLIDENKPSPLWTDEFWLRHGIDSLLGPLFGLAARSGRPPKMPSAGNKEVAALKELEGKHARLAKEQRNLQDKALDPKGQPKAKAKAVAELEKLAPDIAKIEADILKLGQSDAVRNFSGFRAMEILNNRWDKYRKIAKNRTNTQGQRNTADRLAKKLEEDIALFSANWERFGETVKNNPEWMSRLAAHLKQERALMNPAVAARHVSREEILKKTAKYFDEFGNGNQAGMTAQARLLSGLAHHTSVPGHAPTVVDRAYKIPTALRETLSIHKPSEMAATGVKRVSEAERRSIEKEFKKGNITREEADYRLTGIKTTLLSRLTRAGVPRRLWRSQVDVLMDSARNSPLGRAGRVTESEAWQLAQKMMKAVNEGESLSAAHLDTLWSQAVKLGYGRIPKGLQTGEQMFKLAEAEKQVQQFLRTRFEGEPPPDYKLVYPAKKEGDVWVRHPKLDKDGRIPLVDVNNDGGKLVPTFKRGMLEAKKAKEKGEPWAMTKEEFAAFEAQRPKPPWKMTEAEFFEEEAKGMGVTWLNAWKTKDGRILTSARREHGDMIDPLTDNLVSGVRGWVWKGQSKEASWISSTDVGDAKGNFWLAYKSKAPKSPEKAHEDAVRKAFEANKPVPIKVEGQFPKLSKEFRDWRGWASQLNQPSVVTDAKIGNMNIVYGLRQKEARRIYDKASPMAKAIIDGWRKTQESLSRMMQNQGVIIEGKGGNYLHINEALAHFPRGPKPEIRDALRNLNNLNTKARKAAYENLLKWHKMPDTKESKDKLADIYEVYITTTKAKEGEATSMAYPHLESARVGAERMHPQVFNYTTDAMSNYAEYASRRIKQIEHLGQAKTLAGKPNPNNAFTKATRKGLGLDEASLAYVRKVEESFTARNSPLLQTLQSATTGAKIANPYSAIKNLTGFQHLAKQFDAWGVSKAAAKALRDRTLQTFGSMKGNTAEQLGIVNKNTARMTQLIDASPDNKRFQKLVTGGMELSGFGPSERLVREGAFRVAEANVVDFTNLRTKIGEDVAKKIVQYEEAMFLHPTADAKVYLDKMYASKAPFGNRDVRNYMESVRWMIRNNIDPNKIWHEAKNPVSGQKGGVMPETVRYYQEVSNVTQGGYDVLKLPQHMLTSPLAKASQKFTSWTKQMQSGYQNNVVAEANRKNWKPLAKTLALGYAAGEAMRGVGSATGLSRGYGSREASYDEILSLLEDEDYPEAIKLLLIRGAYNIFTAGQGSILEDTAAGLYVVSKEGFGGTRAPIGPLLESGLLFIKDMQDYYRHGSEKVALKRVARQISAFNRGSRVVVATGMAGEEKKELARMIGLKSRMKGMVERFKDYSKKRGLDIDEVLVPPASKPTEFATEEGYEFKNELTDALLLGRGDRAKKMVEGFIKNKEKESGLKLTPKQIDKIKKSLGTTVRNRRPIHVNHSINKEHYEKFRSWITKFNPKLANSIFEMDDNYWRAALESELIAPEKEMTRAQKFEKKSRDAAAVNRVKGEALFDLWWEGVDVTRGIDPETKLPKPLMSPEQKKLHHRQAGKNIKGKEAQKESLEKMMADSWAEELSTRGKGQYVYKTRERTAEYIAANRRRVFTRSLLFAKTLEHRLSDALLYDGFNMSQPEDRIAYLKEHWDNMEPPISEVKQQELFKKLKEWEILGVEDLMMKASVEEAERKEREEKK